MKLKRLNKTCICILVISVFILCFSGCSTSTKHKVLTFFFTGVPSLEEMEMQKKEQQEKLKKKEDKKKSAVKEIAKLPEPASREKAASPAPKIYFHTPYSDGACKKCHRMPEANFTMFRLNTPTSKFSKGGGMPGVLIAPRRKLCIQCHESLTLDKASSSGLWLHTTAAEGDCDACHAPHQGDYPNVLIKTPRVICHECHLGEENMNIPDHRNADECLDCHNPHLGKNRLMLKKDYQEEQHPVNKPFDSPASRSLPNLTESEINSKKQ
jgi:predicted CXXCH cytochrome family protein